MPMRPPRPGRPELSPADPRGPAYPLPQPQQLIDLLGGPRAIQRVEVQSRHALGEQPVAHARGELHPYLAHGRAIAGLRLKSRGQPVGEPRARHRHHPLDHRHAGDRHDPGDDRHGAAPARDLATKCATSVSRSGDRGWPSGNAATPTQKSPDALIRRTSSSAYSRPSGWATHSSLGAPGGSPRRASTFRTPTPAYEPITWRSSATEWLTAVKEPTGVSVVSSSILPVTWTGWSGVVPPATQATETNVGRSGSSWRMARHSCS